MITGHYPAAADRRIANERGTRDNDDTSRGKDELESDWFKDVYIKYGKIPMRRYAVPDEIAEHVAWLGSERTVTF